MTSQVCYTRQKPCFSKVLFICFICMQLFYGRKMSKKEVVSDVNTYQHSQSQISDSQRRSVCWLITVNTYFSVTTSHWVASTSFPVKDYQRQNTASFHCLSWHWYYCQGLHKILHLTCVSMWGMLLRFTSQCFVRASKAECKYLRVWWMRQLAVCVWECVCVCNGCTSGNVWTVDSQGDDGRSMCLVT